MKLGFLPRKEEEGVVSPVVQLGNPNWTSEYPAEIVLAVLGSAEGALDLRHPHAIHGLVAVIEPVVRIEDAVLDDGVGNAMKIVCSRLCGEAFDTRSRAAKLRGRS